MGVAARSMAWQQRRRNRPGPLAVDGAISAGSGEQPTGGPQVEIWAGGWVDVTALGLVRYAQGIQITRGQPDENQRTNPSTARFRLENLDGRFNPRNPLGPYYGLIDKNTPCRISVQSGLTKSYRFYGEIASWPQDWDKTGNDAWVDIQAAGPLRRLQAGNPEARSAVYMYWVYGTIYNPFNSFLPAIAYWPCEDSAGATQFGSGIGGQPMLFSGTPTLASTSSLTVSNPLPVLNNSVWRANVPTYTPAPPPGASLSSSEVEVGFLLLVPAAGDTTGAVVASLSTTGSIPTWEIVYTQAGGGTLAIRCKDVNGTILATSPSTASHTVNGKLLLVAFVIDQFGSNASGSVRVSYADGTGVVEYASTGGVAGTFGVVRSVQINPGGTLNGTTVGHVSVALADSGAPLAILGFPGETAAARIKRLCAYLGVPFELTGNSSDTVLMGQQDVGTFMSLIQECVDADGGILYELTDQIGLGYRTRVSLLNQSPVLAMDYAQSQLVDIPKPVDDDTFTRNDITAQRLNGSFARALQTTGPLNLQAPPAGVGRVETGVTLNVYTDAQIDDEAGWRLHLGTVNEARYPGVGLQLARPEITGSSTLRPQILGVNPGDRVTIANPPAFALATDTISALVIGYTETFDQFLHHISWNTRPESPFRVAVLDDPVFGHLDTDGATLAAPAGPTDTSMQVATTNPNSPLWTTNPADFPFDVMIGGERITVGIITGSTSPQTFGSLTRSVNGVVKPQAVNTSVQLYQPATLSM